MTRDRYLEVNGARLRYRDEGQGPAVVLVHGWTLDLQMWEPQAAFLAAERFRVIRFDRRGFGLSSGEPGIAADAADVRALCRHLGVERAVFVGMSQGARVLERLIAVAPELIRGLVFDGAPDVRPGGQLAANDIPIAEYAELLRTQGIEALRRRWADHPLARLVTDDREMHELLSGMLERYQGNDLREAGAAHAATPPRTPAASPVTPVLILNGALDLESRRQAGAALTHLFPAAEYATIPNAAHLPNLDNSSAYNAILLRFLARTLAR